MITNRGAVRPGIELIAMHKGTEYRAVVADDGYIELEDGQRFRSPSGAGAAAAGLKAVNGWAFWGLADQSLDVAEAGDSPELAASEPRAQRRQETSAERRVRRLRSYNPIKQQPNGRYFCDGCMRAFTATDSTGENCPRGCTRTGLRDTVLSMEAVGESEEAAA